MNLNLHLNVAQPTTTSTKNLPLTEHFFDNNPFSVRGIKPNFLGPVQELPKQDNNSAKIPIPNQPNIFETQLTPLGDQVLTITNLKYHFPLP